MLNPEQQEAVDIRAGCTALLAGPGSGKTEVIVSRFCALVHDGYHPNHMLSLSFTNESAKEMRKRAEKKLATWQDCGTPARRPSGFMTIHSLALSFATLESAHFPFELDANPLALPGVVNKIVAGVIKRYQAVGFRDFLSYLSRMKRRGIRPNQALSIALTIPEFNSAKAYAAYEEKLHKLGLLDFDDLLLEMVNVLETKAEVRERWQYKWIQTDESQDLDAVQWRIVRLLSEEFNNVFSVGDCNQSIYEWRGASPEMFLKFHETFPGAEYKYLGQNYRSTKKIVAFCREIAPIKNELLERFRSDNEEGSEVRIRGFASEMEEAQAVVDRVRGMERVAILARTNRYLHQYEDLCAAANIPYHLLGKSGFWQQEEIRNVVAFLQLAGGQSYDAAVLRALKTPFECARFIKKKDLIGALQEQKKGDPNDPSILHLLWAYRADDESQGRHIANFRQFIQALPRFANNHASDAVQGIINEIGALDYYDEEEQGDPDNNPRENIEELVRIARRFSSLHDFLHHVRKVQATSRVKKGVALSTVHQAKGKEWDSVFLVGASEGMLPHKNGEPAEEARIFFVACSRAAKNLFITFAASPSRFILKFPQLLSALPPLSQSQMMRHAVQMTLKAV